MGRKTKIDWCDSTWNPVTGCLHGCKYCYARRIAERFGGLTPSGYGKTQVLDTLNRMNDGKPDVYPYGFLPTFHTYKLDEPQHWKKPRTIFVCSMADLFGDWVPDEWIQDVFAACEKAPQHRYLFLTKNPGRYIQLFEEGDLPSGENYWYGTTLTKADDEYIYQNPGSGYSVRSFLSIEPILEDFPARDITGNGVDWIIVGAETGNRKDKVVPEREWIDHLVQTCETSRIPIFMKESLRDLMGDDFRQEFPWEVSEHDR